MSDGAAATAGARAEEAWHSLGRHCLVRVGGGQVLAKDGPRRGAPISAVWPLGQVIAAATAMMGLGAIEVATVEPLLQGLERYRSGEGFGAFPGDRDRYFDDNAWIALDRLQLAIVTGDDRHLEAAVSLFGFLRTGEASDGGVYWVEGQRSRNTCSTGPTAQVALRLHDATHDEQYLAFARRQMAFLDASLRDEQGLYRDHVRADGTVEPAMWSYNQGTPIGAAVLLARSTGVDTWLDRAVDTAAATRAHFSVDGRLWQQPPVFNAILFRNLLALSAVAHDADVLDFVDEYLERVWSDARHRRTGLFVDGGIGSYDGNPTIDQAGVAQMYAFRAWAPERRPDIC